MMYWVYVVMCLMLFFFFKQKTAYEMRISDWSSDVCSSDLLAVRPWLLRDPGQRVIAIGPRMAEDLVIALAEVAAALILHDECVAAEHRLDRMARGPAEIGRASCRERVCQYGSISVAPGSFKKKNNTTTTSPISLETT